jgi:hypothetical protein
VARSGTTGPLTLLNHCDQETPVTLNRLEKRTTGV